MAFERHPALDFNFVVMMLTVDGTVGDGLGDFYPTAEAAIAAGNAELLRNLAWRAAGNEVDQIDGWAYGFYIRECEPFDAA
jgi:hypothetical protein